MVADYEYALFSDQAYRNPNEGYTIPAGWSVLAVSGDGTGGSGYFGVAFTNGTDVVIAHRGTEIISVISDFYSDLQLALNAIPNQFTDAQAFTTQVEAMMTNQTLSFTGHSLGGLLAQLSSADEGKHATAFESPGALKVMLDTSLTPSNADVTLYAAAPNAIDARDSV